MTDLTTIKAEADKLRKERDELKHKLAACAVFNWLFPNAEDKALRITAKIKKHIPLSEESQQSVLSVCKKELEYRGDVIRKLHSKHAELRNDSGLLTWLIAQGPPGAQEHGLGLSEELWDAAISLSDGNDDESQTDQALVRQAIRNAIKP